MRLKDKNVKINHVSIEIIRKCVNNCLHCSSVAGLQCKEIIDYDTIKNTFIGLKELNVEEISLSGGEPFLHDDIVDIIKLAKELNFKLNVYTSGIVLEDNNNAISIQEDIIKVISLYGVDKLIFNLQSLNDNTYNNIMGTNGNLTLLKESINLSKKYNIYTEIHFVPMKLNYMEIDNIIKYCNDNNIDRVSFLGLLPHGNAYKNKEILLLDKEQNIYLKHKLNTISNNNTNKNIRIGIPLQLHTIEEYSCNAGKQKLYIKFDGFVYGCEAFKYIKIFNNKKEKINPDNIFSKNIVDIFYNSEYLIEAENIIEGHNRVKFSDEKCPIQRLLRV